MNSHFESHLETSCKPYSYAYQIIEKLPGTGYNTDASIDEEMSKVRKNKEDEWIRKMRVIFPYGLCEKARNKENDCSVLHKAVGKSYKGFPIPRSGIRPVRSRENRNNKISIVTSLDFFTLLNNLFSPNSIKTSFNQIRILLNQTKKKVLKEIAFHILERSAYVFYPEREQWYLYILDIIDTKLLPDTPALERKRKAPVNICTLKFLNKGMEQINPSEIFNLPDIIQTLPETLRSADNIPKVVMKLDGSIRHKILNYEDTVRSIKQINDDEVSFTINRITNQPFPCTCSESTFKDAHHGHIVTGDLRIVDNTKLRKLLSKGPNFREKCTINFNKCQKEIEESLENCALDLSNKYKLETAAFDNWIQQIKLKVAEKTRLLKTRTKIKATKPVLKDEDVIRYLADFHLKYVIVPIDKAANNIAIICKQFYVNRLLKEIGALGSPNATYGISSLRNIDIIQENMELCERYGLTLQERQKTLPIMYWTPKMHYNPSRARFIVSSAKCSTKPLSHAISNTFKLIYNQIQNFHLKSKFYKNYNRFWVVNNSRSLIERLDVINTRHKAREISTYDFSTLYTNLPHQDLLRVLNLIIDFSFDGGSRKFISFNNFSAFWTRKPHGKQSFTKPKLKALVAHLITRSFFIVGNLLLNQSIGIPMGIDPAPFWANLYLYHYEEQFISKLITTDKARAKKFLNASRFIDDECNLNDYSEFSKSFSEIYPPELQLKCEHEGLHATFLDLDISVVNGLFVYKLFDKRDDFPFTIVRMPDLNSNIPSTIFYGAIMSEFLRIARCTLLLTDFIPKASVLCRRMINQGGSKSKILSQIRKAVTRHPAPFQKFNSNSNLIVQKLAETF